jgi:hypothetical protein
MSVSIRSRAGLAIAVVAASAFLTPVATAAAAAKVSRVYIIQGVPGASVQVNVDGKSVGADVAAKAIIGPLNITHGSHEVSFEADNWAISTTVNVTKASTDVVLHWPADSTDEPVATVFVNDLSPVSSDKARLTVAHTAVVPPADILADGAVLFSNIANGQFVTADVPAATYTVAVVPTGQKSDPLLGPLDLPVKAGQLTRVFAIGEPENGSMDAVVQVLPVGNAGSPAPGSVDAGEAGLVAGVEPAADTSDTGAATRSSMLILGVLVAGAMSLALLRGRRSVR